MPVTYKEISTMIRQIGIPAAYLTFDYGNAERPPFIVWYLESGDNFNADNRSYQQKRWLRIELYTEYKDFESESRIESALNAHDLAFSLSEAFITDERLVEEIYETEVIIDG